MSKRFLLAAVFAALVAGGTFAQIPLSLGVGGLLKGGTSGMLAAVDSDRNSLTVGLNDIGGGGFIFADAKYVELAIGMAASWAEWSVIPDIAGIRKELNYEGQITSMDFSLLWKFPIEVSREITIFPLFGVGYNLVLFAKMYDNDELGFLDEAKPMDLSAFRFTAGFGYDVNFGKSLFLRQEILNYLGLPSRYFKDFKKEVVNDPDSPLVNPTTILVPPLGITYKVAIGYRF